ncbi:MAG TPA: TonB-dependent receptor, partial [Chitinophagaceae bacterium]|nr:TonB-dependent receptor [Chitinophagaceae bacterium]
MIRTYRITPAATEQYIDSLSKLEFATKGLHQLLEYRSNVLVKNYGVSSLSTISIRGSSAAQTSVKWQGLNINNAMTGITDFSNLPVGLFDDIRVHYGDHPSQRSLSGSIDLENKIPLANKPYSGRLLYSFESTGNHTFGLQQSFHIGKIANTFKLFFANEQNKFTYYNSIRDSMQTLEHAYRKSMHVMNDFYYQYNSKLSVSWHTWFSSMQREIPAAKFEIHSNKVEDIQSMRSILKCKYRKNDFYQLESSLGFVQENYHYQDTDVNINTHANVTQVPFQCLASLHFPKQQTLQVELLSSYSFLHSQNQHELTKAGLQLNYEKSFFTYRLALKTYVQKEVSNLFKIPLSIGLQAVYRLPFQTDLYATLSQTNRTPTLNELYYNPGGNKNLLPEKSNNLEVGTRIHYTKLRTKLNAEISGFNRLVSNWIVWYGNSILTPH